MRKKAGVRHEGPGTRRKSRLPPLKKGGRRRKSRPARLGRGRRNGEYGHEGEFLPTALSKPAKNWLIYGSGGRDGENRYWFDHAAADRAVAFFETHLRHIKGKKAGEPIILEPWQRQIVRELFGRKKLRRREAGDCRLEAGGRKKKSPLPPLNKGGQGKWVRTDERRYLELFLEVPKKNGKSTKASGIALFGLFADREPGAEIYSGARDREQASITFRDAKQMVEMSPQLRKRARIYVKSIVVQQPRYGTLASYKPLSADVPSKHGPNVHFLILDELHVLPRDYCETLEAGGGSREQPLVVKITTAGFDKHSYCREEHERVEDINSGKIQEDTTLGVIFGAKEADDWTDPKVWARANPNLGVSVTETFLAKHCRRAQQNPAYENTFKRLFLDIWTAQDVRWMPQDKWDACGRVQFTDEFLKGRTCYAGLDLATSIDLAAWVEIYPVSMDEMDRMDGWEKLEVRSQKSETNREGDETGTDRKETEEPQGETETGQDETEGGNGEELTAPENMHYLVRPMFWIPEENLEERVRKDGVQYDVWARAGLIVPTPGNWIDYGFIRRYILERRNVVEITEVAVDPHGAIQIMQELEEEGMTIIQMNQGYGTMGPPTKELMRLVIATRIHHRGNPVLSWMAGCVIVSMDADGRVKVNKKKSMGESYAKRVDGIVGAIMGLDRAVRQGIGRSVYERRGLTVIG